MNYSIDRIIDDIAVCENIKTGKKIELPLSELPKEIKEGSIIIKKDESYILNDSEEENRRARIQAKLNRLKSLKNRK